MILSVTLSKPCGNVCEKLSRPYEKIKISIENASGSISYFVQLFTKTQVFHEHWDCKRLEDFLTKNVGITFKNCVKRTETEEITILTNKKGKQTELHKTISGQKNISSNIIPLKNSISKEDKNNNPQTSCDTLKFMPPKKKNYILPEGKSVPFLVRLGIMTAEGRVIAAKYDKFRQINRFLEIFKDAALEVLAKKDGGELSVVDFGSGKSYLTFAVQYFLTEILKVPCRIFGLDLKKDVIEYCSRLSDELGLENLSFAVGDIAEFGEDKKPDIIITLHACDTATDYALNYAIKKGASAILSVPCCQHEINLQLKKNKAGENPVFEPLLKYGLIKERFSALVTDAVRGELLENFGYKVQMIEFIDDEGTPKNLMIRAIKKSGLEEEAGAKKSSCKILQELGVSQTLENLLN